MPSTKSRVCYAPRVQSTRARIIELLRKAGAATVDDITVQLALAPATVRRHLDVLLRDGLLEMRSERVPLGRPHFVFSLTVDGMEVFPAHHMHLVVAVLEAVLALTPDDTSGKSGREVAVLVFNRLADELVARCRPVVTAPDVPRRVEQALEVLAAMGMEFETSRDDEGFLVRGGICPCTRLLSETRECSHEAVMLAELVGTPVERTAAAEEQGSPQYIVRTRPAGVL